MDHLILRRPTVQIFHERRLGVGPRVGRDDRVQCRRRRGRQRPVHDHIRINAIPKHRRTLVTDAGTHIHTLGAMHTKPNTDCRPLASAGSRARRGVDLDTSRVQCSLLGNSHGTLATMKTKAVGLWRMRGQQSRTMSDRATEARRAMCSLPLSRCTYHHSATVCHDVGIR